MSYNYNKNKKGHKATTADAFRGSSQEVKLTGTVEQSGTFGIKFNTGNYWTKVDDGGKSYTDIKFNVTFTKPAHMNGNGVSYDVPKGTHASSTWSDCNSHSTNNEGKTLTIEVSIYNFGIITFDGNKGNNEHIRYYGGGATYNYKRPNRTLTFNSNGGSISKTSQTVGCGVAFGSLPTATKTGYTCAGWFTAASGGTQYTVNSNTCKDLTLYPHWTANKYNISYNANSGTGSLGATTATYDSNITLAKNTFKKQYYIFDGWSTTANGAKAYNDGQTFKYTKAGNTTLYARWKRSTEKVTGNSDLANVITGDGMFTNDSNIEGSQGTIYNSLHDGLDYAHPDGGIDNPGYYSEE